MFKFDNLHSEATILSIRNIIGERAAITSRGLLLKTISESEPTPQFHRIADCSADPETNPAADSATAHGVTPTSGCKLANSLGWIAAWSSRILKASA